MVRRLSAARILLGTFVLAGIGGALLRLLPLPDLDHVRFAACGANLKSVSLALTLHAQDNGGSYPASALALIPRYLENELALRCPARPRVTAADIRRDPIVCYEYVPGLTTKSPRLRFLLFDRESNHRGVEQGSRTVIFASGVVQSIKRTEWPAVWEANLQAARQPQEDGLPISK